MRCRWGLASLLSLLVAVPVASAQEADVSATATPAGDTAPAQAVTYGAMPGGIHAPSAETLAKGVVEVSTLDGYGRRSGLLDKNHKLNRVIGQLAFAYAPTELITVALSLDGRYDKHYGFGTGPDDGYVGDPHLYLRAAKASGNLRFGGQLGVWVPGKDAPSIAASAISVDIRGLVSLPAGPGTLSFNVGFRLDNSAKSVDDPSKLSLQDRVSLGVSNYNAVLAGAHLVFPTPKGWVSVEGSLDAFVGSAPAGMADPQEGKLLVRGGVTAGMHLNPQWSAMVWLEAAKVPGILDAQVMNGVIPLLPYEPIISGGLGLEARFGGPKRSGSLAVEKDCHKHDPPDCPAVKVPVLADIAGTVVDDAGKPLAGARVSLTLKNSQVPPTATDDKGTYVFKGVPIGNLVDGKPTLDESGIEINVELDTKKPGKASLAQVAQGENKVDPIKLDPVLPPGQLRGVVRALPKGTAVGGATVSVAPGDRKAETDKDGTFSLDLPPGQYKITVTAKGLAQQQLDVTIDPNGVAIKNIDLHR